jgi:hypothetical protein
MAVMPVEDISHRYPFLDGSPRINDEFSLNATGHK